MQRATKTIVKALKKKGFAEEGGDHEFFFFNREGLTEGVFTRVSRSSTYREVSGNRLAEMGFQLKLGLKEFLRLVDCDMEEPEYAEILRNKGVLRD